VYDGLCNMLLHTTHLWMSIKQSGDVLILEKMQPLLRPRER
jgi:hypothetical protein